MNSKKLEKFLNAMLKNCSSVDWNGSRQSSESLYGPAVSYKAIVEGCEIVIAKHDYTEGDSPSIRVLRSRKLELHARVWVEISINDPSFRFGRRAILDKYPFVLGSELYEKANELHSKISKIGKIFSESEVPFRWSKEKSLEHFTRLIQPPKKKLSAKAP